MQIQGQLKNGAWLVRMKRNEIAKLVGLDQDGQVSPVIEVGESYSISSRWNLLKLLKGKKQQLKSMGSEITDLSNSI